MRDWLTMIGVAAALGQLAVVVGLVHRRRVMRVVSLPVYLLVATVAQSIRVLRGDVAQSWEYWALKEVLLRLLMVVVMLEIAARVFAHVARGKRWAAIAVMSVVIITLAAVWQAPGVASDHEVGTWRHTLVVEVLPRLAVGGALLALATVVVMAYYHVPLDPVHRVVLFGLAAFLVCYAGPMASADTHEGGRFVMYYVTPLVYLAVLALWTWTAWRPERAPDAPAKVVEQLHPWRQAGHS